MIDLSDRKRIKPKSKDDVEGYWWIMFFFKRFIRPWARSSHTKKKQNTLTKKPEKTTSQRRGTFIRQKKS